MLHVANKVISGYTELHGAPLGYMELCMVTPGYTGYCRPHNKLYEATYMRLTEAICNYNYVLRQL